ncbi:hypothetical protein [Mycobacterium parascrofulaceum]|uniref:hypothetical protein n=1 Tax=Mycobacterium parascrofulaceum TaxID=240125 RepID=UPI0002DC9CDE|nr:MULTISPECIES: hypothetical protein [Mycobacterium]OCB31378.1 hypothetical protein A9X02_25375 [Mycobacterium malmoense]
MNYVNFAKDQVLGAVKKVTAMQPRPSGGQTVTIACPVERIEQFWHDPEQMSIVLGDIAEVELRGPDRYRWRLLAGPKTVWDSELIPEPEGLRFVGTGDAKQITVTYRPAPGQLGTEVTLRATTPAPDLLAGAAAFKVLYRLRALMQTGEVPTVRTNPSARKSAR